MSDALELAKVRLPVGMQAADVLSVYEQMAQRVAAVLQFTGDTKPHRAAADGDDVPVELPAGIKRAPKLPDILQGPWDRLSTRVGELADVRGARDRAAADPNVEDLAGEQTTANVECDESYRAFESWLEGWTLARDDGQKPSPADALWLYEAVFPAADGLRFVNLRPRRQWVAMKPRMETLAGERAQTIITGLGGARLHQQLAAAHARFGRAYGFLAVTTDTDEGPIDARPEFSAAKDALRDFVRKLDTYAEPTIPGSEALSTFLLKPYLDLVSELAAAQQRTSKKPTNDADKHEPANK